MERIERNVSQMQNVIQDYIKSNPSELAELTGGFRIRLNLSELAK